MNKSLDELKQSRINSIKKLPQPIYKVNWLLCNIEWNLKDLGSYYGPVNLEPDFQRGHVWTNQQQAHYVENYIRGYVTDSGRTIQFNCPRWNDLSKNKDIDLPDEVQIVDGLQRLTALLKFLKGELTVFDCLIYSDFERTALDIGRASYSLLMNMHAFTRKKDLLNYYIDYNSGGTPHSEQELKRVKHMAESC